ncbi:MAG: Bax inhibitor-1/YccA family protein [Alistipes sp.]|jgi:FtsH-binding integral membrane protein|nr:Bax inhibitor-1/YccA family protein [Alistipes sp.]
MANYVSQQTVAGATVSSLIKSVYMQMAAALSITGLVAYFLSQSVAFWQILAENMSLIWVIFIAQIGLVIWLSARITKMSMTSATLLFILYSVLMGVTMSTIFMVYTMGSIASVFFITAGMFLAMSLIGYFTRLDLTRLGSLLFMALIGVVIASVVNIFLGSETLYWIISYVAVVVFVGLTAYDTQKIKEMLAEYGQADEMGHKLALYGALTLYLDFINLFLYLLRIFGDRK